MNLAARLLLAAGAAILGAVALSAQTPVPTPKPTPWAIQGAEFSVNQSTTGNQSAPSIATTEESQGFIVAWSDDQSDGDGLGVVGRRYDRLGAPLSDEFPVNTVTTGDQRDPRVAADYYGNFVVVWSSTHAGSSQILARRFDPTGTPAGPEFLVNTYTTGAQTSPDVAMNVESFVVVWSSAPAGVEAGHDGSGSGIFGQRYSANGTPDGPEFQVNTYTTGEQTSPAIGMTYGPFDVMWRSEGQDGSLGGIFGQRFGTGGPEGAEFQVNTYTPGDQTTPDVAMSNTGTFATWATEGVDGSDLGISGRLFAFGPMGPEFQVNTYTTGPQRNPRVAANGFWQDFVVVWESEGQDAPGDPGTGVFAQRFQNKPVVTSAFSLPYLPRRGSEYQINTFPNGGQGSPAATLDESGQFVIAWASADQDGEGSGVFARRFGSPDPLPAKVDARPSGGSSNVDGVLDPGERVTVDSAWSSRYLVQPLEGAASNLTGPAGPVYTIEDGVADYGIVGFGGSDCFSATGNCYEISISGTRPAQHWDATLDETLTSSSGPLGIPNRIKTWALHVGQSFEDVPQDSFYPYIENILHNGVTAGGSCGAASYCGEDGVLRQQMAVFVLKAMYGGDFVPPPATGTVFDDVPAASPFAPWIEELARQEIVAGCVAPPPPALPSYCPNAVVNRQQMAVFLLKAKGSSPRPCAGDVFSDVTCDNPFAGYIETLWYAGISSGCSGFPDYLYCPTDQTKRKQMAAFLVRTFGLELYGAD